MYASSYPTTRRKKTKLILCLGHVAVQNFFRDKEVDVKSLRGKVHVVDGFSTIVAYHSLAVRRRPNLWKLFLEDWQFLADNFQYPS